jgi:hypothetical protein
LTAAVTLAIFPLSDNEDDALPKNLRVTLRIVANKLESMSAKYADEMHTQIPATKMSSFSILQDQGSSRVQHTKSCRCCSSQTNSIITTAHQCIHL